MDRGDRLDLGLAVGLLLLSMGVMFALPQLSELTWLGPDWGARSTVVMAVGIGACALGIWRLQVSLGWSRRSWRGKALAFLVAPCFILPSWLALSHRALDPEAALTAMELPGLRISLPDWPLKSKSVDYWAGLVVAERRGTKEEVRLDWHAGSDGDDAQQMRQMFEQLHIKLESEEPVTLLSKPARVGYYRHDNGWNLSRTSWSCAGRVFSLGVMSSEKIEVIRRLHQRVLASVSCSTEAPRAAVYGSVKLPAQFKETERSPNALVFASADEQLLVSSLQPGKLMDILREAQFRTPFFTTVVQALGTKLDGPIEELTGHQYGAVVLASDGKKARVTVGLWACPRDYAVWAAHRGPLEKPGLGVDRLSQVACPKL